MGNRPGKMTSRERILCALHNRQPDRVPVVARMNKFLKKHYAGSPSDRPEMLRAAEEFDLDAWVQCGLFPLPVHNPATPAWRDDVEVTVRSEQRGDLTYYARTIRTPAGDLSEVKLQALPLRGYGPSPGPEIVEPLIKDPARDVDKVRYLMCDVSRYNARRFTEMEQRVGDSGAVIADLYGPLDCRIGDAMKQADFLTLCYDDEGAFRELLRIGQEASLREMRVFLEVGAKVIFVWWFYASLSAGWSPRIYENYFLPLVKEQVGLAHRYGALFIHYDDGKVGRILPLIADSGADAVMTLTPSPMGDIDPVVTKEQYGDRLALVGGFDSVNEIERGTPESIRNLVGLRLPALKKRGGYVFDGSNSITHETPVENVRAFARAGHEFGAY